MQSAQTTSTGTSTAQGGSAQSAPGQGRGVFVAQGAWWDNARDGMKSFDLWNERGYGGVDVTASIAWIMS
jgi:hypothetical protein